MGLVLEGMGQIEHGECGLLRTQILKSQLHYFIAFTDSWMDSEDPTFVIPASVQLNDKQLLRLQAAGIEQGSAFCLSAEGTLVSPETK